MTRQKYMVGNWKMNQSLTEIDAFLNELNLPVQSGHYWIAPQILHLSKLLDKAPDNLKIGAQNCAKQNAGALTGETSPLSLKELGTHFVILGHSERRHFFAEESALIHEKIKCALENDLIVIYCVGESLSQRENQQTMEVINFQLTQGLEKLGSFDLAKLIIAYEPVWAIGTGKTATPEMANEVHQGIRSILKEKCELDGNSISILYGGSVKPSNIGDLLGASDIDGGLVGGASLKPSDFSSLCQALHL